MTRRVQRGQVLSGRFRLEEALAEDPLLGVWRAEDLELHRDVAIKVLHPEWMDDADMVERFRFEALAAARLVHENVASTFDVEQADGALYTISEFVDGPTVARLLEHGPLPAVAVGAIGQQAAAGLAETHAQGLVHRAICPQNLLIAPDGRLCIVDFGSVRTLDSTDEDLPDPVFPEPGVSDYWPPERQAGSAGDRRGDVYSLGLVLWEGLTGTPEVGDAVEPRPVRRLLGGLPGVDDTASRLRDLLVAATAADPDERPTASELANALVEICGVRPREELEELVAGAQ